MMIKSKNYARVIAIILSIVTLNNSAQNIKVYFNQPVDNTISSITNAVYSAHLDDTICALINSATATLDMAIWDNGSTKIVTAINNAYNRGVSVRYISATNSFNSALSILNSNISVLKRTATLTSNVMHNKFIVVDNTKILSGSMNFGTGSMFNDFNNIIIVFSPSLAQNYTTEFNEMWGTTALTPNTSTSKFGPSKTNNTIHSFNVSTSVIESYFSPTDNTTANIAAAINSANYTLDVAMFSFTHNDLGDALFTAKNRGVAVRCIIENISYFSSEYTKLINAGITVVSHENVSNDFHHKYCIIDANNTNSDPLVVTGSHNWTNTAENEYDENTLIIHDAIIANQYLEEFTKRYNDLTATNINKFTTHQNFTSYPNPNDGSFKIKFDVATYNRLCIFNYLGESVFEKNTIAQNELIETHLTKGIYIIELSNEKSKSLQKIIIE